MSASVHDVIVIGGGINGVGIARDCALRGIKTLLVEKHDFAKGASGNNTGMIHGGIRYMRYDVGTTRSSCRDSGYIQRIAGHLLHRVPFLFPVLKNDLGGSFLLEGAEIFFEAYDRFQPLKNGKKHTRLSKEEALFLEPGLSDQILGAVTLDEWAIDSYRLVVENAVDAQLAGATVRNYCEFTRFLRTRTHRIAGIELFDHVTQRTEHHEAQWVINATGAWGAELSTQTQTPYRLRPSKGVHIVYPHRISNYGLIMRAIDGRQMFFLPHDHATWIGTTDDDYYGNLDSLPILEDEIRYLIESARSIFPSIDQYTPDHAYAGVRPTLYEWGRNEDELSREHLIIDHDNGVLSIAGGKLASYRELSEEVTNLLAQRLDIKTPCETHTRPLPGFHPRPSTEEVCLCENISKEQLEYSITHELVQHLSDLRGRCHLGQGACGGAHCARRAAQIFAEAKGLSGQSQREELERFHQLCSLERKPALIANNRAREELRHMLS
ncbi:MAG: glycerol-3-phosphate dehydrogenase/oxidase [Myxococcaceae bacterium]|nr:glycerol-3-phosphate dehydrogenase/oxidase [Myxococcaceae bacterium]MBH2006947.1 glycerol-3-phosphate dehydrogenase/oxidase [Myxococcaceae bacterium]